MANRSREIIVKDDGHIDPKVWFGRYGIKYKSTKVSKQTGHENNAKDNTLIDGNKNSQLKISTSKEGIRRWQLGIHQSKKQGTKGWHTLELRLYIMKHGKVDGFQFKQFNNYKKIVEFYA